MSVKSSKSSISVKGLQWTSRNGILERVVPKNEVVWSFLCIRSHGRVVETVLDNQSSFNVRAGH